MLDIAAVYKIIKDAGYHPMNITDGISDVKLNDKERTSYVLNRQESAAKRPKLVLIVARNETTTRVLFDPIAKSASAGGKFDSIAPHIYLFSKHGGMSIVPNAEAPTVLAFIRGQTSRCRCCKKEMGRQGMICNKCGHSRCNSCALKAPLASGLYCPSCKVQIGQPDTSSVLKEAMSQGGDTTQDSVHVTVTPFGNNGKQIEMKLARKPGTRAEETRLYFDPNLALSADTTDQLLLKALIRRGTNMAQPIIDMYSQRNRRLKEQPDEQQPNVLFCLVEDSPQVDTLSSLDEVHTLLTMLIREMERSLGGKCHLQYQQDERAWKATNKLLIRKQETGSFAFITCCPFPAEKTLRVELYVVHEITKDYLFLTNGWICAMCQKSAARRRCGRCGVLRYCSDECYKAHWSVHKTVCKDFVQQKELCAAINNMAVEEEEAAKEAENERKL